MSDLTEQQRTNLRHVALSAHADGFDGRAAELSQDRLLAAVERIVREAKADAWLEGATHGHDPHLLAAADFDAANPYRRDEQEQK